MINLCKTCRHWIAAPEYDPICHPIDPDTFEPMAIPFEVRECTHPALVRFERTSEENGFGVTDASNYKARLCTGPDFGCVRHESAQPRNEEQYAKP